MARLAAVLLALMLASGAHGYDYKYTLGMHGCASRLSGADTTYIFPYQIGYGLELRHRFAERWELQLDVTRLRLYNDSTKGSSFALSDADRNATLLFKGVRLGALLNRNLFLSHRTLNVSLGAGGGLMIWKVVDPASDSTIKIVGAHGGVADFAGSELFASFQAGVSLRLSTRWSLHSRFRADYLSGLGAELDTGVKQSRDRWVVSLGFTLGFSFGRPAPSWRLGTQWAQVEAARPRDDVQERPDSDLDGIPDGVDRCPNSPVGAAVDDDGCPLDSDNDGVPDGRDNCPHTPFAARGKVDVHGCPVDTDFDGIFDYLDGCPYNAVGAAVDSAGCPLDGDGDGVPDGLDDCPNTLVGLTVDKHGCLDLSMLAKPMVLNIDYSPGSFEVDPVNRERLRQLGRLLVFVTDIKLEISGYTDNIGLAEANQKLSLKRANRVRDFLVAQGVDEGRTKVYGRGETAFVASNQTAEGRAQNRRVEIVFYR